MDLTTTYVLNNAFSLSPHIFLNAFLEIQKTVGPAYYLIQLLLSSQPVSSLSFSLVKGIIVVLFQLTNVSCHTTASLCPELFLASPSQLEGIFH